MDIRHASRKLALGYFSGTPARNVNPSRRDLPAKTMSHTIDSAAVASDWLRALLRSEGVQMFLRSQGEPLPTHLRPGLGLPCSLESLRVASG
jgi:hypothetical protein